MKYNLIEKKELIPIYCDYFDKQKVIACDTETSNVLSPFEGYLRLLQISDGAKTVLIDLKTCYPGYWNGQDIKNEPEILRLKSLLENKSTKLFHNAKFDVKWLLYHLDILPEPVFCTFLADQILAYDERHSLKAVCERRLQDVDLDKTEQNADWTGKLTQSKLEYAAADVIMLISLFEIMKQELVDFDLVKIAKLEFDCVKIYAQMELDGVKVNKELYEEKIKEMVRLRDIAYDRLQNFMSENEVRAVQQSLFGGEEGNGLKGEEAKDTLLVTSHEQIAKKLIKMGVPILNRFHPEVIAEYQKIRTSKQKDIAKEEMERAVSNVQTRYDRAGKTFAKGTGDDTLGEMVEEFDALVPLDEFRKIDKMYTSYGPKLLDNLKKYAGHDRLYPDWRQIGTPTGRNSTRNPSIQNIPDKPLTIDGVEYDLKVREAFDYPEGTVGISADLPAIEMRIMAQLSGDAKMIDMFRSGRDPHSDTAANIFGLNYEDVIEGSPNYKENKHLRKRAKIINFAIPYGANEYNLYKKMDTTVDEAREIKEKYFETYSGLAAWLTKNGFTAINTLQIRTHWGRRHVFKDYHEWVDVDGKKVKIENKKQKGGIKRNGFNSPIQGFCSDLMKHCLFRVYTAVKPYGARIVTAIHDEFNLQCPREHAEIVCKIVGDEMTAGCESEITAFPVTVKATIVDNWSQKA